MIPVMCLVQQGQVPAEAEEALKSEIGAFTQRRFQADAQIDWIEVPKGSGFTAARPSTTVIASLQANRPLEQGERVRLLKELGAICTKGTGRSSHEVVIAIRDAH